MKVIYIAGKYRDTSQDAVDLNVAHAADAMERLLEQGWCVICPHTMYHLLDGKLDDDRFLDSGLELVARADAVYLLTNWTHSKGAIEEFREAERMGKEIIFEGGG